jgi:Protein of unknown function (DUF3486)
MPRRPEIDKLPVEVKAKVDKLIADNAFGNYRGLADALQAEGIELSYNQLQAHGAKLSKEILEARREALFLAAVSEQADESGALLETAADIGLLRATQAMTVIDGTKEPLALSKLMSGTAALGKASLEAKKWRMISRNELERKLKLVEQELQGADKPKTPEEMLALIRTEVFGFAQLEPEPTTIDL